MTGDEFERRVKERVTTFYKVQTTSKIWAKNTRLQTEHTNPMVYYDWDEINRIAYVTKILNNYLTNQL